MSFDGFVLELHPIVRHYHAVLVQGPTYPLKTKTKVYGRFLRILLFSLFWIESIVRIVHTWVIYVDGLSNG